MLDYSELNEILRQSGSVVQAADCHGFLSGHLCVNIYPDQAVWEEYLDLQTEDDNLVAECYRTIDLVLTESGRLLASPELDFDLLLPDSYLALPDRAVALGEWCHGFLNGFALGQNTEMVMADEEGKDLIENFTRICHIEAGETADESDEQALFELVEYVRMGIIYIYDLLQPADTVTSKAETYH